MQPCIADRLPVRSFTSYMHTRHMLHAHMALLACMPKSCHIAAKHISDTYFLYAPHGRAHTCTTTNDQPWAQVAHVICNAAMLTSAPHKHIKCTARHAERRLVAQQLHAHLSSAADEAEGTMRQTEAQLQLERGNHRRTIEESKALQLEVQSLRAGEGLSDMELWQIPRVGHRCH